MNSDPLPPQIHTHSTKSSSDQKIGEVLDNLDACFQVKISSGMRMRKIETSYLFIRSQGKATGIVLKLKHLRANFLFPRNPYAYK